MIKIVWATMPVRISCYLCSKNILGNSNILNETRNRILKLVLVFVLFSLQLASYSQSKPFVSFSHQLTDISFADWISPQPGSDYGVYYFRKHFNLYSVPKKFVINISADNRYRLYVNGKLICWGPAVGDLENWNYETVDIAPFLLSGENIITSQVWSMGPISGSRQISIKTAFIVQGESKIEQIVNTNKSWVVKKDDGYFGIRMTDAIVNGGYVAGGTDSIVGTQHPWGWENINFNDSSWDQSIEIGKGNHSGLNTWVGTQWKLKSRIIPFMEQTIEPIPNLLYVDGIDYNISKYKGSLSINIPSNTHVEILLDNSVLTMGFPQLLVSGGLGSKVKIQYQESLFEKNGSKGNRSEWKDKEMKGYYDIFLPDGGNDRLFEPLWIRVFRYAKLTIDTKSDALVINNFNNNFTAYPFKQIGQFNSNNDTLKQICDVAWRTSRLCALETYMDCPYYEQLQYVGDTRIQILNSMYVTGDCRLAKNAIQQLYNSMQPMGLTKSVHPCKEVQIIPPFSLFFIGLVHDYSMFQDDSLFVRQFIPGIKFILDWYISKIDVNGMLGPLPYWNYVDAIPEFDVGSPPGSSEGGSALMTILLAHTIDNAVDLLKYHHLNCDADRYVNISKSLKDNTMKLCFDKGKSLIAETASKKMYSQHTNSFAILSNMFEPNVEKVVADKIINDNTLAKASPYFDFYIFQALKKSGNGNSILNMMGQWKNNLDNGFTTFPEGGIDSRSDCHAWSAHPIYDFLNITCGITSSSQGFKTVEIKPNLGNLINVSGIVTHPSGKISVSYEKVNKETICRIILPKGLSGKFQYQNNSYNLSSGKNEYVIRLKESLLVQ